MVVALDFLIRTYGAEQVCNTILERLYLRKEKTSIFFSLVSEWHLLNIKHIIKYMLNLERLCLAVGFTKEPTATLLRCEPVEYRGELFSEDHKRKFMAKDVKANVFSDNDKFILTRDLHHIVEWFKDPFEKIKQGLNVRQSRFKL